MQAFAEGTDICQFTRDDSRADIYIDHADGLSFVQIIFLGSPALITAATGFEALRICARELKACSTPQVLSEFWNVLLVRLQRGACLVFH